MSTIYRIAILIVAISWALASPAQQRVLLGIFAHPDDETIVGPILARYGREGVKVQVALATDGQKGVRKHAGIAAGEELGAVRREEARCSCRQLGIGSPIFFGMQDASLIQASGRPDQYLVPLIDRVRQLIADVNPDAVVTWGSDGGYGHPDHIAVSLAVTHVFQEGNGGGNLFYVGFPAENLRAAAVVDPDLRYRPTQERYLRIRVPFQPADLQANNRAMECHKSQLTPEEMQADHEFMRIMFAGKVWFRPWFGTIEGDNLFQAKTRKR